MKQFIMPAMAALILSACGNTVNNNSTTDSTEQDQVATAPAPGIKLKDDKLNAIYQHYVHLTSALVKGDVKEARLAGNAIETGAKEISGAESLGAAAGKITATADIDAQRTAYATLSNDFISLVKKSGLSSGAVYVDFCPMAMNDKGAFWLSSDKAIQNPYFGEQMMTCGEVKETIQ
ncbi:DUF3347 domain-containing protein [Chitinophaga tropicalis]|uniref:DUF3347 domain-containing protein n=1 Tax=Chitinophaga tropicalis TaxID=2683588 RepID=A0A7K1U0N0_9BACT|nr:DUF3347 domain-containing protein [Chitinophaga tropicalis]MVT07919.1 DUF3347 domain-containing protein [Chitinophaga tropicalis]